MVYMSEMAEGEITVSSQRDVILAAAPEACREHCPIAKYEAFQAAMYLVKEGVSIELVAEKFGEVTKTCPRPEEVHVCGQQEGCPTYTCTHQAKRAGQSLVELVTEIL